MAAYRSLLARHASELGASLGLEARAGLLLRSIHGVDLDPEAVEITRWSLQLELLGEAGEAAAHFDVPDLAGNIRLGDALSPSTFGAGAAPFDVVLGNPPYGGAAALQSAARFEHQDYQRDLYLLFLERYASLLAEGGLLGVVVSNTWLQSVKLRRIRAHLASQYRWLRVLLLPEKVFRAVVDTHVLVFRKSDASKPEEGEVLVEAREGGILVRRHILWQSEIPRSGEPINVAAPREAQALFRRIQSRSRPLSALCDVWNGIKPFEKGRGSPPQTQEIVETKPYVHEGERPDPSWSPLLRGSLVRRYELLWNHESWIQYGPWLAAPRDPAIFSAPRKIMVRQTGDAIIATLVGPGFVARNNLHVVLAREGGPDLRYVLGLMNSRLMDFVYSMLNPEKGEALAEVKKHHVEALPTLRAAKDVEDEIASLVDELLDLHAKKPLGRESRFEILRARIDAAVFRIYGLSAEEVAFIEKGLPTAVTKT